MRNTTDREGEVVTGHVQRMERGSLILDLERTEGVLPFSEMPHPNNYQRNDVLKCLILEVQDSVKGPAGRPFSHTQDSSCSFI